ncbi:choice-of-anchor I family protein [Zooshikella harenae]|uniref:Choice-of-anchor I family protein n=1 Tax=Zooshikella harenae TaxID=2827238 RepID=A0ABS5ZD03_9GAMM|nr:choice-of-anchor I family protein [Zooshikella harenae]MBU2711936.1 choice-of-anchor I family protein [Zooshikella harenae]
MEMQLKSIIAICLTSTYIGACVSNDSQPIKKLEIECRASQTIKQTKAAISGLTLIGTSIADENFATSAAEIVSYDSCTDKLYVVNAQAKQVDIISLNDQDKPYSTGAINLQSAGKHAGIKIGAANSVATHQGLIAVAIENANKQARGIIGLYRSDTLTLINTFPAGALPDMVSFSKDGRYIATANEGEPSSNYQVDPEGSITLVDLIRGPFNAEIKQINFKAFNVGNSRHHELPNTVRISGPNASIAQDLEPEYLTFTDKGKLFVSLQENNALAKVDVKSARVEAILVLGSKSWASYALDASNKDKVAGNLKYYPQLESLYMPDSIASYTANGKTYIVTANEGDGREYGFTTTQHICDQLGYSWDSEDFKGTNDYTTKESFCIAHSDEIRGKELNIAKDHPLAKLLKDKKKLGRLKLVKHNEKIPANKPVKLFGARSFSIWDEQGQLVYDSGDDFAKIVLTSEKQHFNSTNDNNDSGDDRSDDKGVEPEAIEVAYINGSHYAFIGLERQGGIMVYDISNPTMAKFITYVNNRNYQESVCIKVDDGECDNGIYNPKAGDLGPESIEYFQRNEQHFLAVGNEVSGTTSVYQISF